MTRLKGFELLTKLSFVFKIAQCWSAGPLEERCWSWKPKWRIKRNSEDTFENSKRVMKYMRNEYRFLFQICLLNQKQDAFFKTKIVCAFYLSMFYSYSHQTLKYNLCSYFALFGLLLNKFNSRILPLYYEKKARNTWVQGIGITSTNYVFKVSLKSRTNFTWIVGEKRQRGTTQVLEAFRSHRNALTSWRPALMTWARQETRQGEIGAC